MERTLFIGAGGGIGPRAFHMHDPEMAIDVVDIDPKVLELARTHFFLDDSPRAQDVRRRWPHVRAQGPIASTTA